VSRRSPRKAFRGLAALRELAAVTMGKGRNRGIRARDIRLGNRTERQRLVDNHCGQDCPAGLQPTSQAAWKWSHPRCWAFRRRGTHGGQRRPATRRLPCAVLHARFSWAFVHRPPSWGLRPTVVCPPTAATLIPPPLTPACAARFLATTPRRSPHFFFCHWSLVVSHLSLVLCPLPQVRIDFPFGGIGKEMPGK
jgi:hypothetical protein